MGTHRLSFDFDTPVDRTGSHSEKYDLRRARFGTDSVTPLWVADMDFAAPPEVQAALTARAAHPVYGYTCVPDSATQALCGWLARRHGWTVDSDTVRLAPGVVPTLYAAVAAFTEPGDAVIVQPPIYPPFFQAVQRQGRVLMENPLREGLDGYCIDFDHLEDCARRGARLLLFCSPHNPVGRVWTRAELTDLLLLARRHGLTILCDEIHADLVYAAADGADPHVQTHTPLACLADADDPLLTAVAPSKTFNIPGLGLSATVSTHAAVARRLANTFARTGVSVGNPFSLAGFEAAYAHGEAWLDACLGVLRANRDAVMAAVEAHPRLRAHAPQGSYLAWLDCRAAGLDDTQLQRAWVEAGLGLSPGIGFGAAGSGFMRLNFAVPPSQLRSCLSQLPQLLG